MGLSHLKQKTTQLKECAEWIYLQTSRITYLCFPIGQINTHALRATENFFEGQKEKYFTEFASIALEILSVKLKGFICRNDERTLDKIKRMNQG